jgi:hypothetical protein
MGGVVLGVLGVLGHVFGGMLWSKLKAKADEGLKKL